MLISDAAPDSTVCDEGINTLEQQEVTMMDGEEENDGEMSIEERFYKLEATTKSIKADCDEIKQMLVAVLKNLSSQRSTSQVSEVAAATKKVDSSSSSIDTTKTVDKKEDRLMSAEIKAELSMAIKKSHADDLAYEAKNKKRQQERAMKAKEEMERMLKEKERLEAENRRKTELNQKKKTLISQLVSSSSQGSSLFGDEKRDKTSLFED